MKKQKNVMLWDSRNRTALDMPDNLHEHGLQLKHMKAAMPHVGNWDL
jgi:hypothetical protein